MRAVIVLSCLLLGSAALAAIHPKYYANDQKQAPEALTIVVESSEASICWFNRCKSQDVTLKATVKTVLRSASGLKPGQVITITYRHRNMRGMSGPRPIPILSKGDTVPAFLQGDGKVFSPAARGYSFSPQVQVDR